jgi:hypothetical protein
MASITRTRIQDSRPFQEIMPKVFRGVATWLSSRIVSSLLEPRTVHIQRVTPRSESQLRDLDRAGPRGVRMPDQWLLRFMLTLTEYSGADLFAPCQRVHIKPKVKLPKGAVWPAN